MSDFEAEERVTLRATAELVRKLRQQVEDQRAIAEKAEDERDEARASIDLVRSTANLLEMQVQKAEDERDEARALGLGIKEMADRCDAELTRQLASERQARERAVTHAEQTVAMYRSERGLRDDAILARQIAEGEAASLRAALEKAEWRMGAPPFCGKCPTCGGDQPTEHNAKMFSKWHAFGHSNDCPIRAALSTDSGAALLGFARAAYAMAHELNDGEGPHWEDARDVVALAPCWLVDRVKP